MAFSDGGDVGACCRRRQGERSGLAPSRVRVGLDRRWGGGATAGRFWPIHVSQDGRGVADVRGNGR